jgi:hypothetical protein
VQLSGIMFLWIYTINSTSSRLPWFFSFFFPSIKLLLIQNAPSLYYLHQFYYTSCWVATTSSSMTTRNLCLPSRVFLPLGTARYTAVTAVTAGVR